MSKNKVNVYDNIIAINPGPPPLLIHVVTTPHPTHMVGGTTASATKGENYVLLSALPEELLQRVEQVIQMHLDGI